jgi:hypothetical protein
MYLNVYVLSVQTSSARRHSLFAECMNRKVLRSGFSEQGGPFLHFEFSYLHLPVVTLLIIMFNLQH